MAKRNKYEVVDFKSGGFFIHGGFIGETYFKNKADADLMCDALNMVERLKIRKTLHALDEVLYEVNKLREALTEGTER